MQGHYIELFEKPSKIRLNIHDKNEFIVRGYKIATPYQYEWWEYNQIEEQWECWRWMCMCNQTKDKNNIVDSRKVIREKKTTGKPICNV